MKQAATSTTSETIASNTNNEQRKNWTYLDYCCCWWLCICDWCFVSPQLVFVVAAPLPHSLSIQLAYADSFGYFSDLSAAIQMSACHLDPRPNIASFVHTVLCHKIEANYKSHEYKKKIHKENVIVVAITWQWWASDTQYIVRHGVTCSGCGFIPGVVFLPSELSRKLPCYSTNPMELQINDLEWWRW